MAIENVNVGDPLKANLINQIIDEVNGFNGDGDTDGSLGIQTISGSKQGRRTNGLGRTGFSLRSLVKSQSSWILYFNPGIVMMQQSPFEINTCTVQINGANLDIGVTPYPGLTFTKTQNNEETFIYLKVNLAENRQSLMSAKIITDLKKDEGGSYFSHIIVLGKITWEQEVPTYHELHVGTVMIPRGDYYGFKTSIAYVQKDQKFIQVQAGAIYLNGYLLGTYPSLFDDGLNYIEYAEGGVYLIIKFSDRAKIIECKISSTPVGVIPLMCSDDSSNRREGTYCYKLAEVKGDDVIQYVMGHIDIPVHDGTWFPYPPVV